MRDMFTNEFTFLYDDEKTLSSIHNTMFINKILHNSDNKVLHIIRDGRDTIQSRLFNNHKLECNNYKVYSEINKQLLVTEELHKKFSYLWNWYVNEGIKNRNHKNYFELKYEDLVDNFEKTMKKVCVFLGHNELISYNTEIESAIGKYKQYFTQKQLNEITEIIYPLLKKLNYIEDIKKHEK